MLATTFGMCYAAIQPIARCPLDHLLNPAELKPSAEEWVRELGLGQG